MSRLILVVMAFSLFTAACAGTAGPLPHSLYFLDGQGDEAQVWRLEADGLTRLQITHESAGVEKFAVSAADGSLAFVVDTRLFLVGGDGENRRLIADGHQVDPSLEDYVFHGLIGQVVFSPDGRTLAYSFDGLHLYDLATGEDEHVLTNLGNLLGESFVFDRESYSPGPWSPDGRQLLIVMGYFEGSTLAVMDLEAEAPFRRLRSDGPVCCQYSWAPDGRSVLVANPTFTVVWPGLWRYDAETGEQTVVVPGIAEDGSVNFVGWPQQLSSGELAYFHVNQEQFSPEVGIPLAMVRSRSDGSDRTQVRPEAFRIGEALWAQDGSLAVILGNCCGGPWQVLLARADGSPLQVLIEDADAVRDLAWGP